MMDCFKVLALALLAGLGLAGCCMSPPPKPPPPLPITLEEQARRLGEWSRQFPLLKATTVLAGVRLDFRDENGQARTLNAEGTLVIRQHFDEASGDLPGPAADVLLLGRSFDKTVLEAGRNPLRWWFLRLDEKTAWVGDARRPFDPATLRAGKSASILRADLVPDLLGLSELMTRPQTMGFSGPGIPDQLVVMRVNDFDGTNVLSLVEPAREPRAYIMREIIVDRYTGHVSEVRMYDGAGVMVVRSQLSDYSAVSYGPLTPMPATGAAVFPRRVTVTYPAQQTSITLQFENVVVGAKVPLTAFDTPDFAGMRLISGD